MAKEIFLNIGVYDDRDTVHVSTATWKKMWIQLTKDAKKYEDLSISNINEFTNSYKVLFVSVCTQFTIKKAKKSVIWRTKLFCNFLCHYNVSEQIF